jgi:hypothetical protein
MPERYTNDGAAGDAPDEDLIRDVGNNEEDFEDPDDLDEGEDEDEDDREGTF